MVQVRDRDAMRATTSFHSVRSAAGTSRFSLSTTTSSSPFECSIRGHWYRLGMVRFSMTHSGLTLQKVLILRRMSLPTLPSARRMMMSGLMPMPCSSLTECWAGLDLYSLEPEM